MELEGKKETGRWKLDQQPRLDKLKKEEEAKRERAGVFLYRAGGKERGPANKTNTCPNGTL